MTLYHKVFLAIIIGTLLMTATLYAAASLILLPGYARLEEDEARRNVGRAGDALAAQAAYLSAKISDWGNWDDSYDYLVSRDPEFIHSNLNPQAIRDLKLNLVLLANTEGAIVHATGYDLQKDQRTELSSEAWAALLSDPARPLDGPGGMGRTGIVMLPEGPVLMAARPLLTSDAQGPSHGTIVFGRYLDEATVKELSDTTHLSLTLRKPDDPALPAAARAALPSLPAAAPVLVQQADHHTISGYLVVPDVYDRPALVLVVDMPRTIYAQGQSSIRYFTLALLLLGIAFGANSAFQMQRLLLGPLAKLQQGVERIGQGDLHYRITLRASNEIGRLADAFNEMSARLHDREDQLRHRTEELAARNEELAARSEELRRLNEELEQRVAERTAELRAEVAERKQAQEELQTYAARLERSNRELQDFAYVSSHDLQEPLRKIQAFGDRLRDRYGEVLDDTGRDYLARMQNAAARMQTLIEGLLTYSRVTTKAQPFEIVDLKTVAEEVLSDLEMRLAQVGGVVEVGDLPTLEADPLQMRQLLQNLVGNALKFHREGVPPLVKISGERLNGRSPQVEGAAPGTEMCEIRVEDNGIGFDEKYTDRIFQVFQRLHGRGVYEGAGIGLSVCRKITERHGGIITAHSTPGEGSTFVVILPLTHTDGEKKA